MILEFNVMIYSLEYYPLYFLIIVCLAVYVWLTDVATYFFPYGSINQNEIYTFSNFQNIPAKANETRQYVQKIISLSNLVEVFIIICF